MIKMQGLDNMMLFIALVDPSSFMLAAQRLNIRQANLRQNSSFKQQLGLTLLERTTRLQHITGAGDKYLLHLKTGGQCR